VACDSCSSSAIGFKLESGPLGSKDQLFLPETPQALLNIVRILV